MRKKTFIYMNHHIRDAHPARPVITVQRGNRVRYANEVELRVGGQVIGRVRFRKSGLRAAKNHRVRAWIELY